MFEELVIPAFLRRPLPKAAPGVVDQPLRRIGELGLDGFVIRWIEPREPATSTFFKTMEPLDPEWEARKAEIAQEKKVRGLNRLRNSLAAKQGAMVYRHGRYVWDPTATPDKPAVTLAGKNGDVQVSGGVRTGKRPPAVAKVPADDLGAQVSTRIGADAVKMQAFAKVNGVWKDGDQNAKNPGLLRMTVVNRLRGRLKRGEIKQVAWP